MRAESNGLAFSAKPLFKDNYRSDSVRNLRDWYYEKFKRHITLLLEQKKNRKVASEKGYLNPRALYKYKFSDNIFQKMIRKESSDTTIVFLIDGSGSMDSSVNTEAGNVDAISVCGAVASAFAKANRTVLKNQILGSLKKEKMFLVDHYLHLLLPLPHKEEIHYRHRLPLYNR